MATNKASGKRGRSAVSGKFVEQSTVEGNPRQTVNESTKRSGGKKTGAKRGRSAVSGRIVKQSAVKNKPKETTNESVRSLKGGGKKSGRKGK
jgi:hypothetical protein